jgi:transcriptional regulator with XRE-family HTH domain
MRIDAQLSPDAAMREIGLRLARCRIDLGITQAEVAHQAGICKRTVEHIEAGKDSQLSSLVRLLRVLALTDELNRLIPESGPRPLDLLKLKGKERRRVSSRRVDKPDSGWRWGDQR